MNCDIIRVIARVPRKQIGRIALTFWRFVITIIIGQRIVGSKTCARADTQSRRSTCTTIIQNDHVALQTEPIALDLPNNAVTIFGPIAISGRILQNNIATEYNLIAAYMVKIVTASRIIQTREGWIHKQIADNLHSFWVAVERYIEIIG